MRFYEINSGKILVDGVDIRENVQKRIEKSIWNGSAGYLAV